jgi:hypothetical protein
LRTGKMDSVFSLGGDVNINAHGGNDKIGQLR